MCREIDKALVQGKTYRTIAEQFKVSIGTVSRHKTEGHIQKEAIAEHLEQPSNLALVDEISLIDHMKMSLQAARKVLVEAVECDTLDKFNDMVWKLGNNKGLWDYILAAGDKTFELSKTLLAVQMQLDEQQSAEPIPVIDIDQARALDLWRIAQEQNIAASG
jgi:hypothetical protein